MWPFGPKKTRASAIDVADAFLSEIVADDESAPRTEIELSFEEKRKYLSRCKIYRLAMVLVALLNEEKSTPETRNVRREIEARILTLPEEQADALQQQVREAMADLKALLSPEGKSREMSCARSWFQRIGVDAANPVELTLFAVSWFHRYEAVVQSIRDFKIV